MADDERPEPRTFRPVSPINPSIPRAQTALQNRLAEWAPTLQQLPTPIARSFLAHNQTRAGYGQYPLTNPQAQLALQAALSGQAQTPNPDPGGILDMPRNALEDIRTITTAIPRMLIPNRGNPLYEEAEGLLNLPENIGTALAEGDNLGEDIQNLSEQPGIRMLPGAYVAGNLASGNADELLAHPVYTALDVLPFASKLVKALPVNQAAQSAFARQLSETVATPVEKGLLSAVDDAGNIVPTTINPAAVPTLRPPGAFRTALTRKVDPMDPTNVVPNKIGQVAQAVGDATARSEGMLGAVSNMATKFGLGQRGRILRTVPRSIAQIEDQSRLVYSRDRNAISQIQSPTLRPVMEAYADVYDRHPTQLARVDDLTDRMQNGERSTFTPEEEAFVADLEKVHQLAAVHLEAEGLGRIVRDGDFKTPEARNALVDEFVIEGPEWSRVKRADNWLSKARERQAEFTDRMNWTRDALYGDRQAEAFHALGHNGPVGPVPATQTLMSELDNMVLTGIDGDLARQLRTEVNRIGKSANPRVTYEASVRARRIIGQMRQRKTFQGTSAEMAALEIRDATKWARDAHKRGTFRSHERQLARAEQVMDRALLRAIPARHMPTALSKFDEIIERELKNPANQLTADEALMGHRLLNDGVYKGLAQVFGGADDVNGVYGKKLIAQWEDEARRTWLDTKSAGGKGPVFQHHVPPEFAADVRPRITDTLMSPSQAKARTFDARPYVGSPSVALDHQMMELISRRGSEEFIETFGTLYGKTDMAWRDKYFAETGDYATAQKLVEQTTKEWPPPMLGAGKKMSNSARSADKLRVPKEIYDVMETLNVRTPLDAVFDPVMKVFRTAVLPLAPRWQVYNIFGGGTVMTVAEPFAWRRMGAALRQMNEAGSGFGQTIKEAWDQTQTQKPSTLPTGAPSTGGGGSGLMISEDMLKPPPSRTGKVAATKSWLQGDKVRQLAEQFRDWKATQPGGKTWFGRGVDVSYGANAFWDNLYRTATNIEVYQRALKNGKGTRAAELEAIKGVRSVMQNWDELLPMERQILRTLFPFYSWARFSLGFVMRYPFDHPVRASVMASFARAEMEDQGTGLPENFLGLFQMNQMDENGNAKFLRTSGFNPFRDTADWFTLAGFVGQTNPFISASLQALGVNPLQGGPTLYPTLQYDPETGGLKADTPGFFGALITSTLPQARLINNLVIGNANWNELVQRDPESARRQLQGQLGLPVMTQVENLPQEQIRAEMNRYQMFTDARQEAVKDGKLQELYDTYGDLPINADGQVLSAYIDQLGQLEAAGLLEPLRPQTDARSPAELVRAFGGINRPGPTQ